MTMRCQRSYFLITVILFCFCLSRPAPARCDTLRGDSGDPGLPSAPTPEPTALVPGSEIKDATSEKEPPPALPAPAPAVAINPPPASSTPVSKNVPTLLPDLKPEAMDIGGLPLARLITSDNTFSGLGTFSQLLPKYGIQTYIHGIAIGYVVGQTSPDQTQTNLQSADGFTNNSVFGAEFNLFVGAELLNRVYAEMQVFYVSEGNRVDVDYAQLDIRLFRDFLFIRGGRFRVPLGNINGYPDPKFTFKLPTLPLFFFQVVPNEWEELGVELYGRYSWGEGKALSYAFYVVNGLEQRVAQAGDPITGGAISQMTNNYLDNNDPDKAVGGQIQLEPIAGLSFGLSGYEGVYTITGKHRIYIADGHIGFARGKFTLRGELAATFQETETDTLLKIGGYALASYRVIRYLEPVVMFDGFRLDGSRDLDRLEGSVGLNYYPFPQRVPSASLRGSYSAVWKETGEFANNRFALQAQVAF
jgi:hypothetical protein